MITFFFFLVFIAGLTYQNAFLKSNRNEIWYKRFSAPLIVVAILLIPMLIINLAPSEGRKLSHDEYLEFIEEKATDTKVLREYEDYFKSHPDDLEIRFKYIQIASGHYSDRKDNFREFIFSSNDFVQRQSVAYAEAFYYYLDTIPAKPLKGRAYSNFILATEKWKQNQPKKAQNFLLKEIKKNPDFKESYSVLFRIAQVHFPEDYQKYTYRKSFVQKLPRPQQRYIYFKTGQWENYIEVIFNRLFFDVSLLPFFAALVISIIWMIFLRSLDVFNKEKWSDILTVFLLGSIGTHFCTIGYDYFHYSFGAGIDGTVVNDFLYCTFVIGFSEEIVKVLPWILFIFLTKKAKEPYDYLLYASVSALGFAFVENFAYLENPGNITIRSIMSTTLHMFAASLVAYGFILSRYKATTALMKWVFPTAGFFAACLAHGFYDFWLISPAVSNLHFISLIFTVFSLHVWFKFLNNAMNNSPFYVARLFHPIRQLNLLGIGFAAILMVEYVIFNYRFGTEEANYKISSFGWSVPIFLSYTTVLFSEFKLVRGKWKKFQFNWAKAFSVFGNFGRTAYDGEFDSSGYNSYEGLELRLFVPKSNRYVADKFPISGICVGFITVSEVDNWTLFKVSSEFSYAGHRNDYVIIRSKLPSESLESDKVEIIMLFIPEGTSLDSSNLQTGRLRFTGKAFARPI